jgi:hypothetical protein
VTALRIPDPAVALAAGLAIFPLPPGEKRPEPGWSHRITRNPAVARHWPAGSNIGVACRASGVVGLDLDQHPGQPDGARQYTALCRQHRQEHVQTLAVRTPSGLHLYYRGPAGVTIYSTSGGTSPLGPGIDTRGPGRKSGGYLVGPGSVVDGRPYRVIGGPLAELPAWLVCLLISHQTGRIGR